MVRHKTRSGGGSIAERSADNADLMFGVLMVLMRLMATTFNILAVMAATAIAVLDSSNLTVAVF